ncbi:hypothetical protein RFI_16079 [Reticulomyxa filosa]|uniref:Calponin-homology (CH) domain-containing protein n=1 Tax=Reticulomyxa filosa TaxID=46433 RepID=X6N4B1_RETFI|nr:hypothetical protein RFI_16079 [Reticulomyxa filosa]|eukprot:ETO21125.1 hypothetical protein RFI_16079 [Reticulomyxa filosa]
MEEEKLLEEVNTMVQAMIDRHKDIESKIEENLTQKDLEESIKVLVPIEELIAEETKAIENPISNGASAVNPPPTTDATNNAGLPPPDTTSNTGLPPPDTTSNTGLPFPDTIGDLGLPLPDDTEEETKVEAKEEAKVEAKTEVATTTTTVKMEEVMKTPFQVLCVLFSSRILFFLIFLRYFCMSCDNGIYSTKKKKKKRDMIRQLLGVEPPPDEEPIPEWWLDRDAERRAHVQKIVVRDNWKETRELEVSESGTVAEVRIVNESDDLKVGATYMDRVLRKPEEDVMRRLYIPMKLNDEGKLDNYHILATVYDGAMLGYLLDTIQPDFLDARVIHLPNLEEPLPLEAHQVEDNVQLVLSSAKALGIRLPSYDSKDWMNQQKKCPHIFGSCKRRYINVNKHPELIRLAADNEDSEAIGDLTPYDWIPRWMNRTQKRPLNKPIEDFNLEMFNTMTEINNDFLSKAPVKKYAENPEAACAFMIDYAVNQLGINTNIQKEDLLGNNRLLQDLFAAQVFDTKSGLAKLTKKEQNRFQSIHLDTNIQTADESMCNFINSLLPANLMIHNLKKDLSDGVVICKILDRVSPGCIDWTKIRDKDKIRHKFDKMNNCYVLF